MFVCFLRVRKRALQQLISPDLSKLPSDKLGQRNDRLLLVLSVSADRVVDG